MARWSTGTILALTIASSSFCVAETLRVPVDHPTIQACIDAAISGADECVVAPGIYDETIDFLGKAITVRSTSGPTVTTIDAGGIGGSVVTCASGEGSLTILGGFTITGGTGTDLGGGWTTGGGMYIEGSSPTVTNCGFLSNSAHVGGGMRNASGNPRVSNCTFRQNTATYYGGGMANSGGRPNVAGCTFNGNTAARDGGGIYNWGGTPTITDCLIVGNEADQGGGMWNSSNAPALDRCVFVENMARFGAGMLNGGSDPEVTQCTFRRNAADDGGAIFNIDSNPVVLGSFFLANTATFSGGGMFNDVASSPTVARCAFSGNQAFEGAGIMNYGGATVVSACSFVANLAGYGAGVHNAFESMATVRGSTFMRNEAIHYGGGIYNSGSTPLVAHSILWSNDPEGIWNDASVADIRFCDVQGGLPAGAVDGGGNINLDPMFLRLPDPGPDGIWDGMDDDYGNLRLRSGSPCINAGDPAFVPEAGETDPDGHARVLCGRVDIGAYEFGIGDFDCDQVLELVDFAAWESCMTGPTGGDEDRTTAHRAVAGLACESFDFNADGDVDLADFRGYQLLLRP